MDVLVVCRVLRVVDGNNRCYILCHPSLDVGRGENEAIVRVLTLRKDTPTSALLAISAGMSVLWNCLICSADVELLHRAKLFDSKRLCEFYYLREHCYSSKDVVTD